MDLERNLVPANKEKVAVYAGSFDPFTNGHLDIVLRASKVFDKVIVAIGFNPAKKGFFNLDERIQIIASVTSNYSNIEVRTFSGLLVDFCAQVDASFLIRGIRNNSDFEFEATLGRANRKLNDAVDTVLFLSSSDTIFVSSSLVKEIYLNGGSIEGWVPPLAIEFFKEKGSI